MPIVEELSAVKDPSGKILEAPLEPEAVRHPTTAPPLPGATSTETMTRTPQPQVVRKGQTAVLTIQYLNEISNKPLQVMITLADNTCAAIFDAVNSYLDSQSKLTGKRCQRHIEIRYGVSKNDDVDFSALKRPCGWNTSNTFVNTRVLS